VRICEISPADAARALAGLEELDPRGMTTPQDLEAMTQRGRCFAILGEAGAVYVMHVRNGVCWVDAAKASGEIDMTQLLDTVITAQAAGLRAVACQTKRPGLVKKLERHGWKVSGWVMRKEL
jgi:hypothetical protein